VLLRLWWVIGKLVPDGLWERIAPLLPPPKPRRYRYPGRRPIDDRAALAGIVFVLKTGITWNQLPTSLVGCSGVTCWRRLGGLAAGILTPLG
jgi:transposase